MNSTMLFAGSGIQHSKSGLKITHDMYINDYFMLLLDLTTDRGASKGHTSHHEDGNTRIQLNFNKLLPEAFTCLMYLEFHN